jgi:hypothetical protein
MVFKKGDWKDGRTMERQKAILIIIDVKEIKKKI